MITNFVKFCDKYFKHIEKYKYPFDLISIEKNIVVENISYTDIKVMETVHNRNGSETRLYHVCIWIK